ncbi:hypothetical protein AAY84_13925 [Serratia marcescens]|nr:hypothetical protein AAY84_13925 [Serratia marcescens]
MHTILNDSAKSTFADSLWITIENCSYLFKVHIKVKYSLTQPCNIFFFSMEYRLPDSRNIIIQFTKENVLG